MSATDEQNIQGGLGAVKGLQVSGVSVGLRKKPGKRDLALIVAPAGSKAAGVFTQSNFAAAPVYLSKEHLAAQNAGKDFKALIINSSNANAATGAEGMRIAKKTVGIVATALSCDDEQVLMASTGVIGVQLPFEHFGTGVPLAIEALSAGDGKGVKEGTDAAEAIMTTDTVPKTAARSFTLKQQDGSEQTYTVGGMAKGSGMIAPHMATMIAALGTDAQLEQAALDAALKEAVSVSFNKVTIDSDTSTNDSAYLIATGALPGEVIEKGSAAYMSFVAALTEVCQDLAYQIARDGEGATKVIVVDVEGAVSEKDADLVARAIADSPLVKTAVTGHDANWGRIAMAAGKAGATFSQEDVSISVMDLEVFKQGVPVAFSEDEALKRFEERDEVHIVVDLSAGEASTRIWTCDLTKEYIAINGDYRT